MRRVGATLVALGLLVGCQRKHASEPPPAVKAQAPVQPATTEPGHRPAPAAAADEELVEEEPEANPTSQTVKIKLVADPNRKARVFWGRKDLGLAPLELERPRGSGPLDILVVAPGALPLHTRVFTDRDDKVALRLYAESEGPNLLGYRPPEAAPPENKAHPDAARPGRPGK